MFMGPTWGPPGSCRPQVAPVLAHEICYQVNNVNHEICIHIHALRWMSSTRTSINIGCMNAAINYDVKIQKASLDHDGYRKL